MFAKSLIWFRKKKDKNKIKISAAQSKSALILPTIAEPLAVIFTNPV
jgi:hypothetical protein